MAEEIQLTPEQQAQYDQTATPAPVEINPLRDFDASQLAELAVKDKDGFDLVSQFRQNQDLWKDPAIVQKTADALDLVKQRGFEFSDLPGPVRIGKTVLESAKGFGKQLWNYAGALTGMVQGAIAEPFSTELATGFAEGVSEKLAKNIAGTEEAMAGLAELPRKVVSKVERVVSGPRTAEQKVADLWSDVGRSEVQQQRVTGQGPFTQAVTGGVAGELPAEEVAMLAAGDPFSFATFSKAFQLAGRAIPGAVRTVTAQAGETAGDVAAAVGGHSIQAAGKLTELGSDAVKNIAPTAGAVAGAAKGAAIGGPLAVIPGIGVGAAGGRVIARAAKKLSTAGADVAEVGRQIAGAKPIVSATAQAGRDILQSAPGAVGIVGVGLGQDIGLSALTSETPQETEGAIGIGTALGAAGAVGRVGRRVISGQLVAPREYGVNTITPSSGNFTALDTAHSRNIQTSTPGEQTRLNAVRLFTRGAAPNTDVFFIKDPAALSDALIQSGVPRDTANQFSQQEGFFTVNLPDRSGTPRPVIIARNVEAAPHESFHAIQDVLGEAANREIDNTVRQSYADQWENIGQRYAGRLVGDLAGRDWRETILDESGWGHAEAVEKLSREVTNEVLSQTGAEPAPDFVQSRVRAEWARIAGEARQRNPQARPEQMWREVLSPEEATQTADRYLARELAAENFDVVFKNLGSALDSNQPLLRRLAGTAARLISTLGGEPLAGRRSDIGQIEPRFAVTEAVTAAGRPTVQPKAAARPTIRQPVSVPTTAEAVQDSAVAAREIASSAPDTIQAGGTSSPRELLGQVAEAIAQRAGVKINYLSAPDQPAAAILSNRTARREIIEAFRTMPPETRALWEKNFFPERVLQTKGGKYQVLGWAPEVFAANAHKLAGWLVDHPTVTTAYAIDPATRSFTPDAWQQLFVDTQQFVRNQQSGATGAGAELVVPRTVTERGFTAPARTGGESSLSQDRADVINMLFGFKLPETPRMQKGRLPLAIVGEEVSAATQPGRVEVPVRPRGEFAGAEAEAQGIAGRSISEVNPFRQRVEQAGNPPSLIESVQRLNLENIKEVALAPELPEFRGNTLTLTAGFQPSANPRAVKTAAVRDDQGRIFEGSWHGEALQNAIDAASRKITEEGFTTNSGEFLTREQASNRAIEIGQITAESARVPTTDFYKNEPLESDDFNASRQFQPVIETAKRLVDMSPEEWKTTINTFKGKFGGGLTGWAFDLGASAKDAADVMALRESAKQLTEAARAISVEEENGFNRKMELVGRAQAAREAFEMATGSNLEGTNEGSAVGAIRKYFDPNYKPPVPGNQPLKTSAQPKAEGVEIRDIAERYATSAGIDYVASKPVATVNQELSQRIADWYDSASHSPDDPAVEQSYDALSAETIEQLRAIQEAGYTIEPWTGEGEPYKSSAEMVSDVRSNKHLFFLPTEGNFDDAGGNLMLQDSGTELGSVNNVFRAVHDFFGHAKEGYQFGPKGELNAWRAHSDMYSPEAQGALAAETLAQNSWVNFGKQVRDKNIPLKDRPFAEQKNVIVPDELIAEAKGQFQPRKKLPNSATDEQFRVVHYSSNEGLKKVDPKFFGKGKATSTDLRGGPKSYFFVEGSDLGQDSALFENAGLSAYEATIPGSRLYDLREGKSDELGWRSTINREEADDTVRSAGYDGLILDTADGREVVAMFKAVPVKPKTQFQPAAEQQQDTLFALPDPSSFPEAVVPKRGQKDIPSDIAESPLAKQAETREAAISLFANKLKQEAERQNTNPAYQLGLKWYQEFTPMLRREFGADAELMAELLAATSPQTNVETNFGYAIDVLNNWKAGKYTKLIEKWNEGYKRLDDGSLKKIYDRDVKAGRVSNPPDKPSGATYMAWWVLKHDLLPRGTSGAQVGLHSKNVAKVLARRWLSETRGPKTKNFVKNLLGTGKEATIDIWADRLLRRIGYEGEQQWRILPEHARGVTDDDFEFGQAVFRQAADELGVEPMDLQAALWFTEKQRWADNGWSELDLGDFRTEIRRTAEYREGFVEGRGPAEVRRAAKQQATPEFEQVDLLDIRPRRRRVR